MKTQDRTFTKKCPFFIYLLTFLLLPIPSFAAGHPAKIVATFSILGDFAKTIGGDAVSVTTLVGPDSDAHSYKPTPDDVKAMAEADMVIENGLGMEGWVDRLVQSSGYKGMRVTASTGITPRQMNAGGEEARQEKGEKIVDPHAWQDITNARRYVESIASALVIILPQDAIAITARAKAYDAELGKLDNWVKSELATIPNEKRKIITSHDAFGYFATAYHVTFLAPQGVSTETAPTATQIAKLIDQMKAEKVRVVFFENMTSPKLVEQLAKEAGASVGEPVYSDALSAADGPAASYVDMFHHNVALFKEAMQKNGP